MIPDNSCGNLSFHHDAVFIGFQSCFKNRGTGPKKQNPAKVLDSGWCRQLKSLGMMKNQTLKICAPALRAAQIFRVLQRFALESATVVFVRAARSAALTKTTRF
jgi:hypothetical protein